jgi:hypothetical protein
MSAGWARISVGSLAETAMVRVRLLGRALMFALGVLLATNASAQQTPPASEPAKAPSPAAPPTAEPALEPKAIDILQASSRRLAAARSLSFTAVVSYESPSLVRQHVVPAVLRRQRHLRSRRIRALTTMSLR